MQDADFQFVAVLLMRAICCATVADEEFLIFISSVPFAIEYPFKKNGRLNRKIYRRIDEFLFIFIKRTKGKPCLWLVLT